MVCEVGYLLMCIFKIEGDACEQSAQSPSELKRHWKLELFSFEGQDNKCQVDWSWTTSNPIELLDSLSLN